MHIHLSRGRLAERQVCRLRGEAESEGSLKARGSGILHNGFRVVEGVDVTPPVNRKLAKYGSILYIFYILVRI